MPPPATPVVSLACAVEIIRRGELFKTLRALQFEEAAGAITALNFLGEAARALGLLAESLEVHFRALALDARDARTLCATGESFQSLSRFVEAKECFAKALAIAPEYAPAWSGLGYAGLQTEDVCLAADLLVRARELDPEDPDILNRLGLARLAQKNYAQAVECFVKCTGVHANFAPYWNNLASAHRAAGNLGAARLAVRKALDIRPDASGWTNLGVLFQESNQLEDARECYSEALKADGKFALAHVNLGLALLLEGELSQGWIQYEYRWLVDPRPKFRYASRPVWRGEEDLSGKVVLLHSDQGFGDTIQFLRFAQEFQKMGARVHVEVHPALLTLAGETAGVEAALPLDAEDKAFDYHCPFLSIPFGFRTTLETIPDRVPYLRPSRAALVRWGAFPPVCAGLRVGLCWRGNPKHSNDRNRSIELAKLRSLLQIEGVSFFNLQVDPSRAELEILEASPAFVDPSPGITSFDDTAAVIQKLDLVIAVDSAVAHLAGALGKAVWVLLPFAPDWRWMLKRLDSPWYPSARLFRQRQIGDWSGVVEQVCLNLRGEVRSRTVVDRGSATHFEVVRCE